MTGVKSEKIRSIYLFGSVARGDFDEESDVDIFIDTVENREKDVEKLSHRALFYFYRSDEYKKFKLMGVKNQIKIKCGDITRWDLFTAISSEGLLLYSSTTSDLFTKYFLVVLQPINDIAKRNRVIRQLVGRNEAHRRERGLIEEIEGSVLDARHYIVPAHQIGRVTRILSKENAVFELREIWMLRPTSNKPFTTLWQERNRQKGYRDAQRLRMKHRDGKLSEEIVREWRKKRT